MTYDPLTSPAGDSSPDADRAGPDASARLPEWVVHLIAQVIHFILSHMLAGRSRRSVLPPGWDERPDLPPASAQAAAASVRGAYGNSIAWMCLRRGIGPGHPDWPYLSRTIVAFGGSVRGFRAGMPARGLQWWENPDLWPGMIGETTAAPAAAAMAVLVSQQAAETAPSPAPTNPALKNSLHSEPEPALLPKFRWHVLARTATGPPTGPPSPWAYQFCCSCTNGARAWPAPPY